MLDPGMQYRFSRHIREKLLMDQMGVGATAKGGSELWILCWAILFQEGNERAKGCR
jgi:hypothetical protein